MTLEERNLTHEFWSEDLRFGLRLGLSHFGRMISQCIKSYPNETGGILVGFYNQRLDCAEVTHIFFEPSDSRKGKTWFVRGIHGLQDKLNKLWSSQKGYYLGEWHFHPGGTSNPSQGDINQMLSIASSSKTHCPEPILLIFSGNYIPQEVKLKTYVFSDRDIIELHKR